MSGHLVLILNRLLDLLMISKSNNYSQGVTLIELVVSIVIISIAVIGVMSLFLGTTKTSADPMIRAQALAIAQSYMDEIMMQPYSSVVNTSATGTCSDGNPPEKSNRAKYNDINDYNALNDIGAHDQNGCLINALAGYTITVQVNNCPNVACDASLNSSGMKKIQVDVLHSGLSTTVPLFSYRADY